MISLNSRSIVADPGTLIEVNSIINVDKLGDIPGGTAAATLDPLSPTVRDVLPSGLLIHVGAPIVAMRSIGSQEEIEEGDTMTDMAVDVPIKFTTQAVDAMNRAYEEVCSILQAMDADYTARAKAGEVIMQLGRNGETDKRRLRDEALGAAGYDWR